MLARYTMYRGKRPRGDPLPDGDRQDTRTHTRHCLRPDSGAVRDYLAEPTPDAWKKFAKAYERDLMERFRADRGEFDDLAKRASDHDVFLGCSCPTKKNPDVRHCHTVLALRFMKSKYPDLEVRLPGGE